MSTPQNTNAAPSLASVLSKTVSPDAWFEFKEGIAFKLRFMPKSKFRAIADKATEFVYDKKTKARAPKLNANEFTSAFLKEAVLDWRGVTLRTLSRISEISVEGYTDEQLDASLTFSHEELSKLLDMVYDLDGFINDTVADIASFRPFLEEEAKNSKSSPTTS